MNESKSDNVSKKSVFTQDQFKSTRKWNEILDFFFLNMPLKRHWKNFRTFNDCFTASEAIEWIYSFLKSSPNFQHLNITRQNAIKLLQIYLKERIIEDVRSGENFSFKEFQDDNRIYRFCMSNPIFANRNSNSSTSTRLSNESIMDTCQSNEQTNIKSEKKALANKNSLSNIQTDTKLKNNRERSKENNFQIDNEIKNSHSLNTNSLENLTNLNSNAIRKRNSSPILKTSERNKDQNEQNNTFATSNNTNQNFFIKTSSSIEAELWSRIARKMLESILRKVYLLNSIGKSVLNTQNNNKIEWLNSKENDRSINCHNKLQTSITSPKSSSTLKRSNDIKIGLINILGKKSYDILLNLSGANIEHNTNNINKHGVVINTDDDLPIWVVRAMHTLLNWESDNDCEYPKFGDVFQEIVDYFNSLGQPLLTNEMSYLFMEIFDLMITKSNEIIKNRENKKTNELIFDVLNSDNRDNLNFKLKHLNENEESFDNICLNNRILNLIVSSFNQIVNETNSINNNNFSNNNQVLLDIERHLLENAKLNLFENNMENEPIEIDDDDPTGEINLDKKRDREEIYFSLLMDSLAKLENCCASCKIIYDEINTFLNQEQNEHDTDIDQDNHEFQIKRKKFNENMDPLNDFSLKIIESESTKRLHRNNSFKAAIDDKLNRLMTNDVETDVIENTKSKKYVVRSSTNNSNDFNLLRSILDKNGFMENNNVEYLSNDENFDLCEHEIKNLIIRSNDDELNEISLVNTNTSNEIVRSKSLCRSLSNNNLSLMDNSQFNNELFLNKATRKRKASSETANNVDQLVLKFNNLNNDSIIHTQNINIHSTNENETFKGDHTKITPSISLSSFKKRSNQSKKLHASISLQVLTNINPMNNALSNKNIQEINSFIKKSLKNKKNQTTLKDSNLNSQNLENPKDDNNILLSTEIESEIFCFLISSFRLLALMLPPSNKRKLHFLLRFLNKLKYSKHIDEYLLKSQYNLFEVRDNNFGKSDDFEFIDVSISNNSKLEHSELKLSNVDQKTNQVEQILISSFLKSIILYDDNTINRRLSSDNTKKNIAYASKISQILINNYSEIMRIPEDLISNFKQKLKSSQNFTKDRNFGHPKSNKELSTSTDNLNKLCDNIKPKTSFRNFMDNLEDKQYLSKGKYKEYGSNAYQQNQKIKKALNILGLNDSISYASLSQKQQEESTELTFKKDIFSASLNENANKTNQYLLEQSLKSNSSNTNYLNSSTLSAFPSKSTLFQSTSSINFPRIFSNKKWKKENLI
ncbi:unnamed protein product [Brachionus calyciflorus]|uniref:DEP domain-containing protein n=1 Tax=Brachionus calyciflorus TaxID=104777 RepID=A0A814EUP9_9BILA|nr:unnamed protein product [Brachionus calyciflorus]